MAEHKDVAVLKKWFERDLRYADWEKNVEVVEASGQGTKQGFKHVYRIHLYTDTNCYSISAKVQDVGEGTHTYLGCVASSRKPRAGEEWTRGNDLPDGPLNEETWCDILAAIVGYELVKVHAPKEASVDLQNLEA